jgi:E3 SUMO-protein ligase PIAS1
MHSHPLCSYAYFTSIILYPHIRISIDLIILTNHGIGLQSLSESDTVSFDALARRIRATAFPGTVPYLSPTGPYQPAPVSQSPTQGRSTALGISMSPLSYTSGPSAPLMNPPAAAHKSPGPLVFKESPFYTILEPLTPVVECKGMSQWTLRGVLNI